MFALWKAGYYLNVVYCFSKDYSYKFFISLIKRIIRRAQISDVLNFDVY